MSRLRWAQGLFLVCGAALFGFLVYDLGVATIVHNVRQTGWWFAAILAVWTLAYTFNTISFSLLLGPDRRLLGAPRIFGIVVAGYAMNYMTPVAHMGGEPFRMLALREHIGGARAVAVTVSYKFINLLSHICYWILGLAVVTAVFKPPLVLTGTLLPILLALLGGALFWLTQHRTGVCESLLRLTAGKSWLGFVQRGLSRREATLLAADAHLRELFQARPRVFGAALCLELLGRIVASCEYYFVLHALGQQVSPLTAIAIDSANTLILNVLFFMPLDLGTREGGLYVIMRTFGLPASLGVFAALVNRVRELCWILIGLTLGHLVTRVRRADWSAAQL